MSSILQELEKDSLNPSINVGDLLRKAKIIATKLNLTEFLNWIEKELSGYQISDELPKYRTIPSELQAWNPYQQGWQPVIFEDSGVAKMFSQRGATSPISELEAAMKSGKNDLGIILTPDTKRSIISSLKIPTDVRCFISVSSVMGIVDKVRNLILDWSLKLDKIGVQGDGFVFTATDQEKAQQSVINYNIEHFTGTIGNISDNAAVYNNQINNNFVENTKQLIAQIKEHQSELKLPAAQNLQLSNLTTEIEGEIEKPKPNYLEIINRFRSLKTILEGVAGNIISAGILSFIHKILGGSYNL